MTTSSPPIALGIDHGEARIGVAASDLLGFLAHPVATIETKHADFLEQIATIATQRNASVLVVGLPIRLDGTEGTAATKVRKFAAQLHALLPELTLEFEDESLTTVSAAEKMRASGRKAKNSRHLIDQAAAVEILQSWLDRNQLG